MRFALLAAALVAAPTPALAQKKFALGEEQTVEVGPNTPMVGAWYMHNLVLPANELYRVRISPGRGADSKTKVRIIPEHEFTNRNKVPIQWVPAEENDGQSPDTDYTTRKAHGGRQVCVQLMFAAAGTFHFTVGKYAPPPLGEEQAVEVTANSPRGWGGWYTHQVLLPSNELYRVRVSPAKGAKTNTMVRVIRDDVYSNTQSSPALWQPFETSKGGTAQTDYTMKANPGGKRVCVELLFQSPGTFYFTITRPGDEDAPKKDGGAGRGADKDEVIRQLRAEVAELKKQLADQKKQLDAVTEFLKKKM